MLARGWSPQWLHFRAASSFVCLGVVCAGCLLNGLKMKARANLEFPACAPRLYRSILRRPLEMKILPVAGYRFRPQRFCMACPRCSKSWRPGMRAGLASHFPLARILTEAGFGGAAQGPPGRCLRERFIQKRFVIHERGPVRPGAKSEPRSWISLPSETNFALFCCEKPVIHTFGH